MSPIKPFAMYEVHVLDNNRANALRVIEIPIIPRKGDFFTLEDNRVHVRYLVLDVNYVHNIQAATFTVMLCVAAK